MARSRWSISVLLSRGGAVAAQPRPAALIRFLSAEQRGEDDSNPNSDNLSEIARRVCHITRTRPRWEQSLVSDFPSFDFSNPSFLCELFKLQSNLLISMRFFYWYLSHYGVSPDADLCRLLFDALVEANACCAAKSLIDQTGFTPGAASLERYAVSLFEGGLIKDAMEVFRRLKGSGITVKTETWNVALSGCVKARRTNFVWELYSDLVASGTLADMGEETVGHLVRAFCLDGEASRGYELLRLVLEDGLVPQEVAFNKLISMFCETRSFDRVSELLHIMIEKNCTPSIRTYNAVVNGLLKGKEEDEALRVFDELKVRGYAPDRIMYTTMIRRLCDIRWVNTARKLFYEMISKGFLPDEYTVCRMIRALFGIGYVKAASRLFIEMSDKDLGSSTLVCNTMIRRLIWKKKLKEAVVIFKEMPKKGITRDFTTYLTMIRAFRTNYRLKKSWNLYREAKAQGLIPPASAYETLANTLPLEEAVILELCEKGLAAEAKDWLVNMLMHGFIPRVQTFETLLQCLTRGNGIYNSYVVLGFMFKAGCPEGIRRLLIAKIRGGVLV